MDKGLSTKLLRVPIAVSRARSSLAYLLGMFRRAHDSFDIGGSSPSARSLRFLDVLHLLWANLVLLAGTLNDIFDSQMW